MNFYSVTLRDDVSFAGSMSKYFNGKQGFTITLDTGIGWVFIQKGSERVGTPEHNIIQAIPRLVSFKSLQPVELSDVDRLEQSDAPQLQTSPTGPATGPVGLADRPPRKKPGRIAGKKYPKKPAVASGVRGNPRSGNGLDKQAEAGEPEAVPG